MTAIEQLHAARARTQELCNAILASTTDEATFREAFRTRDLNHVEALFDGMDEDMRMEHESELRFETLCGCNGTDSPYHTYFGLEDYEQDIDFGYRMNVRDCEDPCHPEHG